MNAVEALMTGQLNLFVLYGLTTRILSIVLLLFLVLPTQLREFNRQYTLKDKYGNDYWKLARELVFIVMIVVVCAIIPITYQTSRLDSESEFTLQNWSSFFTNTGILAQSIGWVRVYRAKYERKKS